METTGHHNSDAVLAKAQDFVTQGRINDARLLYRDVLTKQPHNYQALTRLALLEYSNRVFDSAIDLLRQAALVKPDDYDVLLSLGLSYHAAGRAGESIPCLEKVVHLHPDNLQAYLSLASVHQGSGQLEAALKVMGTAKKLKLFDSNAQCRYARLLEQLAGSQAGAFDDAIQAYRTSLDLNPFSTEPAARLALLLEKIDRIGEAEKTACTALAHTPADPWLRLALAKCRYRQQRYEEGIECLREVNIHKCPPQLRVLIGAELGALHDKTRSWDRAYEYFTISNQQAKKLWDAYSNEPESYIQRTEQLLRQVERIKHSTPPVPIQDGYSDPVFLIGFPRSGTTLLDQILNSHADIHTLEEIPIFDLLLSRSSQLDGRYPLAMEQLSGHEIAELRASYFDEVSRHIKYRRDALFVDKLPLNIGNLLLIKKLFPEARLILAIRHPCDACLSCFMQNFSFTTAMASFYSLESTVQLYDLVMRLWLHFEQILDLDYHLIRYEDVVEDLEAETRRLLTFLGLEWDENMRHFDHHARNRLSINTPSYRQVRQPIYRSSLYRWQRYQHHFQPVLPLLHPYIDRFGYSDTR